MSEFKIGDRVTLFDINKPNLLNDGEVSINSNSNMEDVLRYLRVNHFVMVNKITVSNKCISFEYSTPYGVRTATWLEKRFIPYGCKFFTKEQEEDLFVI